jgi:integrase
VVYLRLSSVSITLTSTVLDVLAVLDVVGGGGGSDLPPVGISPAKIEVDSAHIRANPFSERFKTKRLATKTKHDTERAPASVNREFELLSRIFTLAIDVGKADSNPCSRVQKFELDNERYRYLEASEETALMAALVSRRAHLHPMVIIALGLGLRKREQLNLRRDQIDFFRNVVIASKTKGKRNREIPMDVLDERVKPILMSLCARRRLTSLYSSTQKLRSLTLTLRRHLPARARKRAFTISNGTTYGPRFALAWH